jgi:hypothetical protein
MRQRQRQQSRSDDHFEFLWWFFFLFFFFFFQELEKSESANCKIRAVLSVWNLQASKGKLIAIALDFHN